MAEGSQGWSRSVTALLVSVFGGSAAGLGIVTALGKQVYDLTDSELALGLLGLAQFAPAALLVLVTGAIADRFDRRRVVALGSVAQAAFVGGLGWYASTDPTSATPIFALVFGFGVARAFTAPSARSLPADVVSPEGMPWLVPRNSTAWQAGAIVGPVLGGTLYSINEPLPFVAGAALFLVAAVAVLLIRYHPSAAPSIVAVPVPLEETAVASSADHGIAGPRPRATLSDALEGLRFIRRQPVLLGVISLDLFAVLFGGAVALLPAIAEDRLGTNAVGLGWLRAADGMGAALTTLVLTRRPVGRHVGRTLLIAVGIFGTFTVLLGVTTNFVVAFVALAILSGADAVSVFIRATLVPLVTPREKRGRVLAVENVFIGASNELGAFESGVAGAVLGSSAAIALGGAATVAVAAGWWVFFPALRQVDRFPASSEPP